MATPLMLLLPTVGSLNVADIQKHHLHIPYSSSASQKRSHNQWYPVVGLLKDTSSRHDKHAQLPQMVSGLRFFCADKQADACRCPITLFLSCSCSQQISHQGVCGFKIAHLCHDMCCAVLCHDMRCDVLCMLSVACHSWAALHGTETGSG